MSPLRIVWFFLRLVVVVAIAVFLVENPGAVEVRWFDLIVETSVGILVLTIAVLFMLTSVISQAWTWVLEFAQMRRDRRNLTVRQRGQQAVMQGLVAVSAENPSAAVRYAHQAEQLLGNVGLVAHLNAEVGRLTGDEAMRRTSLMELSRNAETAFMGLRELIDDALADGNLDWALKAARRARKLQPKSRWALETLFALELRDGEVAEAEHILEELIRQEAMPTDVAKRQHAAILVMRSQQAEQQGFNLDALAHAERATRMAPTYVPAAVRSARLQAKAGRNRQAERTVETAWRTLPHPDLAVVWGDLGPAEPGKARLKWFERLVTLNAEGFEGELAAAEAALAAGLWDEARALLKGPLARAPSGRAYRLLAWLEHGQNGDGEGVRNALAKAIEAAPDPAWVCSHCGAVAAEWNAVCGECHSFASLEWRVPKHSRRHVMIAAPPGLASLGLTQGDVSLTDAIKAKPPAPDPAAMASAAS